MSLHAQISPEAQAALEAQKRTSTISALIIALLTFGLVILILMVIALTVNIKSPPEIISFNPGTSDDDQIDPPETTTQVQRKPTAPSSSMAKVIASASASPTAVPTPDIEITEPSLDFGNGDDFGDGWAEEATSGAAFASLPSSMKKRCSKADRLARLDKEGGTPACEDAVVKALEYLQGTQNPNGSWEKGGNHVGYTGLALLAYLGHCETPSSPEFGVTVENAIVYLVEIGMANDGRIASGYEGHSWVYEHGIATYALAEAYTLCSKSNLDIPNLAETVEKAGLFIAENQHPTGGWAYSYDMDPKGHHDTSVTCWQLQALKACKYTGLGSLANLETVARKGLEYLESCQNAEGGVCYRPGGKGNPTMTGGSILCHQQWGKGSRGTVREGRKYITNEVTFGYDTADAELYGHYYNGQAMINFGGTTWANYNKLFRDDVLNAQNPDGSFKPPGGGNKIKGVATHYVKNAHYRTCLATLMLEVYYRFLPGSSSQ